jgi:hypothetical protein
LSSYDAHINQQVLILAFGDQWQSQVADLGRGLNSSSASPQRFWPTRDNSRRIYGL